MNRQNPHHPGLTEGLRRWSGIVVAARASGLRRFCDGSMGLVLDVGQKRGANGAICQFLMADQQVTIDGIRRGLAIPKLMNHSSTLCSKIRRTRVQCGSALLPVFLPVRWAPPVPECPRRKALHRPRRAPGPSTGFRVTLSRGSWRCSRSAPATTTGPRRSPATSSSPTTIPMTGAHAGTSPSPSPPRRSRAALRSLPRLKAAATEFVNRHL